ARPGRAHYGSCLSGKGVVRGAVLRAAAVLAVEEAGEPGVGCHGRDLRITHGEQSHKEDGAERGFHAAQCNPALATRSGNCSRDREMQRILVMSVAVLIASRADAQTAGAVERSLATPTGHDVSVGVSSYTYREPDGDTPISIHPPK